MLVDHLLLVSHLTQRVRRGPVISSHLAEMNSAKSRFWLCQNAWTPAAARYHSREGKQPSSSRKSTVLAGAMVEMACL